MTDINNLLLSTLRDCQGDTLFVADENCLDMPFQNIGDNVRLVTNRFDIATQATAEHVTTGFSDFDFSACRAESLDSVVYRISKEKAVVHHIANCAASALKHGGTFWLFGGKQEGIKTFAKTIANLLGAPPNIRKEGQYYLVRLTKATLAPDPLDDRQYRELRQIFSFNALPVVSKPGLFGWDKIDKGSELLANYLPDFFSNATFANPPSLLDLGCGYGYISLMAHQLRQFTVTATDNCAAAIAACRENFVIHQIQGEVIADDCASDIDKGFDFILCNPPFHQGFQQEQQLTDKFLTNSRRLLNNGGRALFVVNQFVPLDSLAVPLFKKVDV